MDIVPSEVFIHEAQETVKKAREENIILRILGGLGVAIHCQGYKNFARTLGRIGTGVIEGQEYSDIDYVSYRNFRDKVIELFNRMGYAKRKATLSTAASERQIYFHPKGWFYVDVFFDKLLVANHPINFKGRLDYPTISVTDMLMEKLQIWEAFGVKDLKDCILLLKAHEVKEGNEKETIDSSYIAGQLAQDWGFWYTFTTNLKKLKKFMSEIDELGPEIQIKPEQIEKEDRNEIIRKIDALLERIDKEPKPLGWKIRAKVGTKKRWYNPVERPETVGGFKIWGSLLKEEGSF
ncbi:MAG: hypothetical protein QXJ17_03035 [Nitrososphaeria archaeon]